MCILPSQEEYEQDGNPFNIRHPSTMHNAEEAYGGNPFAPVHTPHARPQGMQGPFCEPFRDPSTAGTVSTREQSTAGEPLLAQSNLCLMSCARTCFQDPVPSLHLLDLCFSFCKQY